MHALLQAELEVSCFCTCTSPNGAGPHLWKGLYNQLCLSTNYSWAESKLPQMKQIATLFLQGRSCVEAILGLAATQQLS